MKKAEKILADSRDVIAVLQYELSKAAGCNFAVCRELAAIACELVHDQCRPENGVSDDEYAELNKQLSEVLYELGNLFIALKHAKEKANQPLPWAATSLSQPSLQSED